MSVTYIPPRTIGDGKWSEESSAGTSRKKTTGVDNLPIEEDGKNWLRKPKLYKVVVEPYKKKTNTRSKYVTLTAFPQQRWLQERAPMSHLYVHYVSCFNVLRWITAIWRARELQMGKLHCSHCLWCPETMMHVNRARKNMHFFDRPDSVWSIQV